MLENLCMQLHEYEAELPTETFGFIEHLGSEFGVADRCGAVLGSTGLGRASDVTRLLRLLVSVGLARIIRPGSREIPAKAA